KIRKITADHMIMSRRTSAHVTSFFEIDYSRVAELRRKHKAASAERGVNLTYLAFIAKACAENLRKHPVVNAAVSGDNIIYRRDVHIATVDDVVARDRGVHHRMFPQILGTRLRDEREVREIHAALGGGRLVLAAELGHTAVVDLEEARHVRRRTARHDHVIRGDLADLRKRLDPVTGPGLDD